MTSSDQDDELALQRLIAQAGAWSATAPATAPGAEPGIDPAMADEHPLETLLRWWGRLRFPDGECPEIPPQGRSERGGVPPRG